MIAIVEFVTYNKTLFLQSKRVPPYSGNCTVYIKSVLGLNSGLAKNTASSACFIDCIVRTKMASGEYYENSRALQTLGRKNGDRRSICSERSAFYVLHEDYFYQFYCGKVN